MRGQLLKSLLSLVITLLCLGSLLTTLIWYTSDPTNVEPQKVSSPKKSVPQPKDPCNGCREIIANVMERYAPAWEQKEDNRQKFRSQLSSKCHGFERAIITQANTAVGSKLVYDGERKRTLQVTPEIFSTFAKEHPFPNKTWETCAVVGNGGILANSSCGETIDSAQFVVRCNLPPLENGYEKHVGVKTDLVTANPSILFEKYGALMGRRRPFVESLRTYGNSLLLIPAFSFGHNTPVSLRALYTIEDFNSPTRPVFFNPEYLQSLALFWRAQGLRAVRLSSGIIMASLALELCSNVHLYGFWPFSNHPNGLHALRNHYYDDRQTKSKFHAMPAEFDLLLRLHSQGVLRLHLGDCRPGEKSSP
ncbi:alpha-2,8-sialyltransferase 8E isoform X2 [Brachionichthys hirsutus]|uniref:alpha-2,8-sialyltransferase 8E isoform X2 n=1 Tax=Brachionichthys hirsutus TaxID=412623 RepID=UPI00360502FD